MTSLTRSLWLACALVAVGYNAPLYGQTLAFTPNGTGVRQDYRYSLGLFFDLSQPLTIASVGYWDDNLDGISAPLTVAIFTRGGSPGIVTGTRTDFSGTLAIVTIEQVSAMSLATSAVATRHIVVEPIRFQLRETTGQTKSP